MSERLRVEEEYKGGNAAEWTPRIIQDVREGPRYGYEVVIVKVEKSPANWRERLVQLIRLQSEPIIISETGISLDQAVAGAKGLRALPRGAEIEESGFNICVRAHDPLRLLKQIADRM